MNILKLPYKIPLWILFFILPICLAEDKWVKESEQASVPPEILTYSPLQAYTPALAWADILLEYSLYDDNFGSLNLFNNFNKIEEKVNNINEAPSGVPPTETTIRLKQGKIGYSDMHLAFEDANSGVASGEVDKLWWRDIVEHPNLFTLKTDRPKDKQDRGQNRGKERPERPTERRLSERRLRNINRKIPTMRKTPQNKPVILKNPKPTLP